MEGEIPEIGKQKFLSKGNVPEIPDRKISILEHNMGNDGQIGGEDCQHCFVDSFGVVKLLGPELHLDMP